MKSLFGALAFLVATVAGAHASAQSSPSPQSPVPNSQETVESSNAATPLTTTSEAQGVPEHSKKSELFLDGFARPLEPVIADTRQQVQSEMSSPEAEAWDFVPAPQTAPAHTQGTINSGLTGTPLIPSRMQVPARNASSVASPAIATPRLRVIPRVPQGANIYRAGTFSFQVVNEGAIAAESVKLAVEIDGAGRIISTTPGDAIQQANTIYFALGALGAGETRDVSFDFQPESAGQLNVIPRVTSTSAQTVTIGVSAPKIEIAFEGATEFVSGAEIKQRVVVRNVGDERVDSLTLRQACQPSTAVERFQFENSRNHIVGLEPGQYAVLNLSALAIQAGNVQWQIAVEGDNVRASAAQGLSIVQNKLFGDLSGPHTTYLNSIATYSITVSNEQSRDMQDVQVKLQLPPGMQIKVVDREANWNKAQASITWTIPTLRAGESETIPFKATMTQFGEHALRAVITNGTGSSTTTQWKTQSVGRADIDLKVITSSDPIETQSATQVTVQVQNRGTHVGRDIAVALVLPRGVVASKSEAFRLEGNRAVFDGFALEPGQSRNLTVEVSSAQEGDHVIRAEVREGESPRPIAAENSVFFYSSDPSRVAEKLRESVSGERIQK